MLPRGSGLAMRKHASNRSVGAFPGSREPGKALGRAHAHLCPDRGRRLGRERPVHLPRRDRDLVQVRLPRGGHARGLRARPGQGARLLQRPPRQPLEGRAQRGAPGARETSGRARRARRRALPLHPERRRPARAGGRVLVVHMHGELSKARCLACSAVHAWREDLSRSRPPAPAAAKRGGLRPDVVWFGETPYFMDEIYDALAGSDHFVSIGTSGSVWPAAGFALEARRAGIADLGDQPGALGNRGAVRGAPLRPGVRGGARLGGSGAEPLLAPCFPAFARESGEARGPRVQSLPLRNGKARDTVAPAPSSRRSHACCSPVVPVRPVRRPGWAGSALTGSGRTGSERWGPLERPPGSAQDRRGDQRRPGARRPSPSW